MLMRAVIGGRARRLHAKCNPMQILGNGKSSFNVPCQIDAGDKIKMAILTTNCGMLGESVDKLGYMVIRYNVVGWSYMPL